MSAKGKCPLDGKMKRLRQCEKKDCQYLKRDETIEGGGIGHIVRRCGYG